ncbi:MAG: DUF503 domain-containing protein, partial [Dehalococcoidales bacterium]
SKGTNNSVREQTMNIGVCKIDLRIPENETLKGKRMVVQSIIARVRDKFHVSVAEVENGDMWQIATIGVCCVSNDNRHTNEMISRIVDFIETTRLDVEVLNCETEFISVF